MTGIVSCQALWSPKSPCTGGWTSFSQDECSDEVLAWDTEAEEWVEIGRTKQARCMHAVTTIQMDHPAMEHCIDQESMI